MERIGIYFALLITIFTLSCNEIGKNRSNVLVRNKASDSLINEIRWRVNCINLKQLKYCTKDYCRDAGVALFIFPTLFNIDIDSISSNVDTLLVKVLESYEVTEDNFTFDTSYVYWLGFNKENLNLFWKIFDSADNGFYQKTIYSDSFSSSYSELNKKDVRIMLKRPELFNPWMRNEISKRRVDTIYSDLTLNQSDYNDPDYNINIKFRVF